LVLIDARRQATAAKKAFITNRVGDWGFVMGIMLTFFLTGSISFFNRRSRHTSALHNCRDTAADPFT